MGEGRTRLPKSVGIVHFVTKHALDRWMERSGNGSATRALTTLVRHLEDAEEVELAPQFRAKALLDHELKPARYLRSSGWVFVVSSDGGLITIHAGTANRWVPVGTKPPKRSRSRRPR